ncbi:hypothetical protein WK03_17755 [Burkholderia cepacia]|uniref:DUF4224 domain-containing protein n=1 Tax=Burkholderia cepacia TaxID=292 RepID=UPI00076BE4EC|nr:hypothetical protein WK03_17755 [Burkholderia cepacia]OUE47650.1 hypothetical protein BZY94_04360 [Burkholderia territorii]HDR9500124.1 DUF4224 domain-containing protein [Burkholderia cepacia]
MHILTNDELVQLTGGLRQGAAQIRWIERQLGFKPPRKVDGHPMITWEQINGSVQPVQRRTEPKWKVAL